MRGGKLFRAPDTTTIAHGDLSGRSCSGTAVVILPRLGAYNMIHTPRDRSPKLPEQRRRARRDE
jgi:hypothetical protein